MKLRRFAAIVACMAMTVGIFAGCGAKEETTTNETEQTEQTTENTTEEKKVLRVGMECAYAPYNWSQKDDSNGAIKINNSNEYANGYDVMMAAKIAEGIGYDVEIHKIDWNGLPSAVVSGKIDVAIAGMSITSERLQTVDFTDQYYLADVVAVTKSDSKYAEVQSVAELDGAICTSQLNTIWYDMIDQIPNANKQPAMEDVAAMLVALTSGKVDVVVCDRPTAMAAVFANPELKLLDFPAEGAFVADEEDVNIGIAISKENTELKDEINKVLATISEEDRAEIMQKAIEIQPLAQ